MCIRDRSGGGAAPSTAAAGAPPAGETPKAGSVTCRSTCVGLDVVQPGSVVHVTGEALETASTVVFLGAPGSDDDVAAAAGNPSPGSLDAQVPAGVVEGPLVVVTSAGAVSKPTREPVRVASGAVTGGFAARIDSPKVFFGGRRPATIDFFVPQGSPQRVTVELVRGTDGRVLWTRKR